MIERQTIDGREASVAYLDDAFTPADRTTATFIKVLFDDGEMAILAATPDAENGEEEAAAFAQHREQQRAALPVVRTDDASEALAFVRYRARQRTAYLPDDSTEETAGFNRRREKHSRTIAPGDPLPPTPAEQVAAWATAIRSLDRSEIAIRDSIERDLAGKTGKFAELRPIATLKAVNRLVVKVAKIREAAIKAAFVSIRDQMGDGPLLDIPLARWAHYFAQQDTKAIDAAIQSALAIGDDSAEIARKVVGSMHLNGVDGVTELTRHKLAHLGRAAIKRSIPRK